MKYPVNTTALTEARMYARESIEHTMDYEGWEDKHKQMERIVTGTYCQLWLGEYCRLNKIPYQNDRSSPHIHDNGDLYIAGYNVDCKSSYVTGLEGQINPHHDSENNTIDVYAFFRTDMKISFIEPLGMINKNSVIANSIRIEKGQKIPGTNITQRFRYSYFVTLNKLTPLNKALHLLRNKERVKQVAT